MYSAYAAMFMMPWTRRRYDMPNPLPGIAWIVARLPVVVVVETARRICPPVSRLHEKVMRAHRENWHDAQMEGRSAAFDASGGLRR
jgi:hypothetical protein